MKYCQKCGRELVDEAIVCPGCGCNVGSTAVSSLPSTKFCQKCGKELIAEAVVCPSCGCAVGVAPSNVLPNDQINIGLCILAALIPLFGLIYWPLKYKEIPRTAKACGITAVIAAVVYLLLIYLIRELAGAAFILFLVSLPGG